MPTPASRLPARPSLEQLRKQAKELLNDIHMGVEAAIRRLRASANSAATSRETSTATLADAQLVLAREYGFDSWPKLVHHVDALRSPALSDYMRIADDLARAYRTGDITTVRTINAEFGLSFPWDREPEKMQERLTTWFLSTDRTADLALVDAQRMVASQAGFDSWDDLAASIAADAALPTTKPKERLAAFYRIDETARCVEIHGPVPSNGWDAVFALMKERKLEGLKAGGQMTNDALRQMSRRCHDLRLLDIGGSNAVTDDGLGALADFTMLEDLYLGGWDSTISDDGLSVLRQCIHLRTFHMGWHRRLSDAGLAHLATCDKLRDVNVMGTPSGDGVLNALTGKAALARVRTGDNVTAPGLVALQEIPHFRTWHGGETTVALMGAEVGPTFLMLPQHPFSHGGLTTLANLDGLFGLSFFGMGRAAGAPMTGQGIAPLTQMSNLGFLSCDPSDDGMERIAVLPHLRMLACQDTRAGDAGFIGLSRSTSLEYIWGRDTQNLGGRGFVALSTLGTLRGLATNLQHVDDESLAALSAFPSLRELSPMDLRDESFRHVGRCERLESLWLMYCQESGDIATEHLSALRQLKCYYAGATKITDRSLELLAAMHSLEEVRLSDCYRVTDEGVARLSTLPRLRRLELEAMPGVSRGSLRVFGPGVQTKYGW